MCTAPKSGSASNEMRYLATAMLCLLLAMSVGAEEAPGWDVSQPDFSVPPQDIRIETQTGTWMSLDVSPDGRTIAFDLLGDIYVMPFAGGQARNISAGFHWDMQPRFSPDGEEIAFTSDRNGADNIWIMRADGSEPRQITKEEFELTNNPSWSPDGQYIAARKHFTTQRSLGAGEIWLYHVAGGKGVAAVERPNKKFQKELGEPVFSPDGMSLYYSQNVTPGDQFIYAQDTNKEVFRIKRLTLETGEIQDIAGGPGGAVRPTPSPDGKLLAFVRRVRAASRLFVKDLETGDERMLVEQLDQDMQEGWAVHGVYPNIDFTPDSKNIVYWSNGGIHRVEVATGNRTDIAFRVNDTRQVYAAPRFVVDVAPDRFRTRMVRWAQKVPGRDAVIFESLGRLFRQIDTVESVRLTRDNDDVFEFFPTLSRDGAWVYYVRWDDQNLGQIMRVSSRGGSPRQVTRASGHYRELTVSPDGKMLAVRRAAGGPLLSDARSLDPGIYVVPVAGGELTLVTRRGADPQFAAENDRLYLVRADGAAEEGGAPPRKLVSMDLDGGRVRDHAGVRFPRALKISPDGSHLAFVENYHAYVTPLPRTGKLVKLGAKAENLPIKRLTALGATFLHWQDASTVAWSIGPTYKSASMETVYSDTFEPVAEGVDLSFSVDSDKPTSTIALTNARIVTMGEAGVIERGTLVVQGNRLQAVGDNVSIPQNAVVIDLDGKTIVPGLIDAHAHGPYAEDLIVPQQNWSALGHLALGVTTVHDPSSQAVSVFAAAEYARAGRILAPRTYSTAEVVYGAKGYGWARIDSLDDARAHVRRLKVQGAISVKSYIQPRREQRQQLTEAARREGMMVVSEGGALYHMDLNMVADGNTGIEHSLPLLAIYDDVVQFWRQTNVGYTPTLVVGYGTIEGENYWYQHSDVWKHPLLSRFVPPKLLQARSVRRTKAPEEDYRHAANAAIGKQLADAGVLVNSGAHGQREGLATHWELWMFVQGGMTPLEALRTATSAPAEYLGMDKDLGSLEAGKLADLVVIDGDVTKDIRVSDKVTHVMLNGRLYDAATLAELHSGDHRLEPFYWSGKPESAIR